MVFSRSFLPYRQKKATFFDQNPSRFWGISVISGRFVVLFFHAFKSRLSRWPHFKGGASSDDDGEYPVESPKILTFPDFVERNEQMLHGNIDTEPFPLVHVAIFHLYIMYTPEN